MPKEAIDISGEETIKTLNEIEVMWHEKVELESQKQILQHQFEIKFGQLPAELISQIESIKHPSILTSLSEQILFAETIEEIKIPVQ